MVRLTLKFAVLCAIITLTIAHSMLAPEQKPSRKPEDEFREALSKYPSTILRRNLTPEQIEEVRTRLAGVPPSEWRKVVSWFQPVKKCSFEVTKTIDGECKLLDNVHGCWGDEQFYPDHEACPAL